MGVNCVEFSPDGKTVLTACWDATAQVWDSATGQRQGPALRHPYRVSAARFTPDGRTIATCGDDGIVRWWDTATGYQLIGTLPRLAGALADLAFSQDGKTLATAGGSEQGGTVNVWDFCAKCVASGRKGQGAMLRAAWTQEDTLPWYGRHFASYSPDARSALSGGSRGFGCLWDAVTAQPRGRPLWHFWDELSVTAYSPDARLVATASQGQIALGDVRLWDAASGRSAGPPLTHYNWVAAMEFSPDGKVFVTGGYDRAIHLWDTHTGRRLGPPLPQGAVVQSLAFSPDGKTLAVGHSSALSGPGHVTLWDVPSRRKLGQEIDGPKMVVGFSPDGQRLLAADPFRLRLWNASTGQPASPSMSEVAAINCATFSPDGKTLLAGSIDGTVRLWDANSGRPIGRLRCIRAVSMSWLSVPTRKDGSS